MLRCQASSSLSQNPWVAQSLHGSQAAELQMHNAISLRTDFLWKERYYDRIIVSRTYFFRVHGFRKYTISVLPVIKFTQQPSKIITQIPHEKQTLQITNPRRSPILTSEADPGYKVKTFYQVMNSTVQNPIDPLHAMLPEVTNQEKSFNILVPSEVCE